LDLYIALGDSLIATQGYAAPDTEHAYRRAWELCQQVGDTPRHFQALAGLRSCYAMQGAQRTAYALEDQLFTLAHQRQNSAWLLWAHLNRGVTLLWMGAFTEARTHLEQVAALHDARQPQAYLPLYGDPVVIGLSHMAMVLWALGYPEQALHKNQQAQERAETLADPFSLAYAEATTAMIHQLRREGRAAQTWSEAVIARCTEESIPFWLAGGMMFRGWALGAQKRAQDGIAQFEQGLQAWRGTSAANVEPYWLTLLAEGYGQAGDAARARALVAEALARMEHTEERWWAAELYRVQGNLTLQDPAGLADVATEAEACFLHAIAIACEQQAKSLELRAATSLGQLWQQQGKDEAARQMLEAIYGWFTEGFDTPDLQEAKALLMALGSPVEGTSLPAPTTVGERPATSSVGLPLTPSDASQTVWSAVPRTHPIDVLPPAAFLHHEGDYWTLVFQGTTCRVKNTYGMHYLSQLLRAPHHDIHVLTLIHGSRKTEGTLAPGVPAPTARQVRAPAENTHLGVFTDADEVLDAPARAAYRQRLTALRAELDEAQSWNDLGRGAALLAEIDCLTQELIRAVGLGGRARKTASPAERARVNVTRAIKSAITRIAALHPACGHYLAQTITTGTFCVYTPDPKTPITWQV
jgi:predicted ATPase